jgi:predicted RNA polymerase sigma factor
MPWAGDDKQPHEGISRLIERVSDEALIEDHQLRMCFVCCE